MLFSANANVDKREAIILAATRLAAAVKATVNPGEFEIYADNLEDLKPRVLELAFAHLEKTHTVAALPPPGEVRELGDKLYSEEYRKAHENDESNKIAQWKREAEANPLTDEDRKEIRDGIDKLNQRMADRAKAMQQSEAAKAEERAKNHQLLLGIEFFLQLKRVKRDRERLAQAAS